MNAKEFVQVVQDNVCKLGTGRGTGVVVGCPLWVALTTTAWIDRDVPWEQSGYNPCPEEASIELDLAQPFTDSVANAWDIGYPMPAHHYETKVDDGLALAGFIIGVVFRIGHQELPKLLTAGEQ